MPPGTPYNFLRLANVQTGAVPAAGQTYPDNTIVAPAADTFGILWSTLAVGGVPVSGSNPLPVTTSGGGGDRYSYISPSSIVTDGGPGALISWYSIAPGEQRILHTVEGFYTGPDTNIYLQIYDSPDEPPSDPSDAPLYVWPLAAQNLVFSRSWQADTGGGRNFTTGMFFGLSSTAAYYTRASSNVLLLSMSYT